MSVSQKAYMSKNFQIIFQSTFLKQMNPAEADFFYFLETCSGRRVDLQSTAWGI